MNLKEKVICLWYESLYNMKSFEKRTAYDLECYNCNGKNFKCNYFHPLIYNNKENDDLLYSKDKAKENKEVKKNGI